MDLNIQRRLLCADCLGDCFWAVFWVAAFVDAETAAVNVSDADAIGDVIAAAAVVARC